jgi:hypothetical protein
MYGAIALPERIAPAWEAAPRAIQGASQVEVRTGLFSAACEAAGRGGAGLENDEPPQSPKIEWTSPDAKRPKAAVQVSNVDPADLDVLKSSRMTNTLWSSFLSVRTVTEPSPRSEEPPPLWGSYSLSGEVIRFEPRFPLEPGIRYRAKFDPVRLHAVARELSPKVAAVEPKPGSEARLVADFFVVKKAVEPSTTVAAVYPSGPRLPENVLRFYIHFSSPMSQGEAYRHLKLIDTANGKPVHAPFLELEEELWSPDGTRFTLFIDPGRIKRGLKPRELFGPVLESGKSYTLVIETDWPDAQGNVLKSGFHRSFRAGEPDESMPDPKKWVLQLPPPGTRSPLQTRFPEPLDRALLERLVSVQDSAGGTVHGGVSIVESETIWSFTPESPWQPGAYRLVIGTDLEDVAGNSVGAPFEVDLTAPITTRVDSNHVVLPFRVGSSGLPEAGGRQ